MVQKFLLIAAVGVTNFHSPKATSNTTNNRIEKVVHFETVSLLFDEEGISSSMPIYNSDTDLLSDNDTRSIRDEISISIEAEAGAESSECPRIRTKQPRRTTKLEITERISPIIISVVAVVWATC